MSPPSTVTAGCSGAGALLARLLATSSTTLCSPDSSTTLCSPDSPDSVEIISPAWRGEGPLQPVCSGCSLRLRGARLGSRWGECWRVL